MDAAVTVGTNDDGIEIGVDAVVFARDDSMDVEAGVVVAWTEIAVTG